MKQEGAPAMRLDDVLKFFGIASTGGHAKHLIQAGEVRVNGVVETRRGRRAQVPAIPPGALAIRRRGR